MSFAAKAYIAVVITVGMAVLAYGMSQWNPQDLVRFAAYLALAIPASCLKVRLPGITGTMSVLFLFLLAGVAELGMPETLVIGSVCVVVQSYWHARVRPKAVQIAFSIANISFAIGAAHWVYHWTVISALASPYRLAIAASAFFVTNTFPIAVVIALTENKSLRQIWSRCYCWSFPYYLVGSAIVGVFFFANRMFDWQAWLVILPVVYVIYRSYYLYLDQLEIERKHAEEERKHSEEVAALHVQAMESLTAEIRAKARLDTVIQASPLAVLTLDKSGNVTSWNAMAEQIFGWSPEEAVGRPMPFIDGPAGILMDSIVERTLRGELVSGAETKQLRKDGSPVEAAIWTNPLRDRGDSITGILLTIADVGDRKRLEDQLRLSQKMEAVGRLAGGVAHDFNNLLTVINGYSAMLADSVKENRYVASQAEEILAAGTRAAELVSQLLTFSRRQIIKPRPLEINQFVLNIERMLRRIIGEHIELRTVLDSEAGWIKADLNQMEAVMLNLVTNARDAMPDGGTLTIETNRIEVSPGQQLPEQDLAAGSYVRIVVSDTGHGIDEETRQHLFEPFFTTKQRGKGTGLGLSSVYGGVEQNQGRVFVASELGKGAAFSIYLPRIESPEGADTQGPARRERYQGSETILLVEDEAAVRRMLREALSHAGYRVWEAGNGAEAIEQWGEKLPQIDLVVSDMVMPVMNGLKMAEELRSRRPDLKVVFMSGHSEDMINGRASTGLMTELLTKPFMPDALVRKVRQVLDQSTATLRTQVRPWV